MSQKIIIIRPGHTERETMVVFPGLLQDRVIKGKYWEAGTNGIERITSGKTGKMVECSGKKNINKIQQKSVAHINGRRSAIASKLQRETSERMALGSAITNSHRCSKRKNCWNIWTLKKSRFLDMILIRFKNLKNQSFYHSRIHEILERYFGHAWTRKIDIQQSPRFRHPRWCQNIWVGGSNEKQLTVFPGMQRLNFLWIPRTLLLPGEVNEWGECEQNQNLVGQTKDRTHGSWDSITANRDEMFSDYVRISR